MSQGKRKGQANGGGDPDVSANKMVRKDKEKNESLPADAELEINPFLLHPVLKVMMSQMTIEDLKKSRGVSTLWDHTANLQLQKLTSQMKPQVLTIVDQIQKFTNSLEDSSNKVLLSHKMRSTLKVLCAQRRRFFQNFEPKSLSIETESEDTNVSSHLLKILQFTSEHIKKFHIDGMYSQFGRPKTHWPKILKLPQLEEMSFSYLMFGDKMKEDIHCIIENIAKKAPNLKSLKLHRMSINHRLCGLLTSIGLIEKLEELTVCYGGLYNFSDMIFAQDLLDMAQAGLKLTKFTIFVTILGSQTNQVILGVLDKLKKFLASQSDTLLNLNIFLSLCAFGDNFGTCKLDMPPLPKLKVLEIGIGKKCLRSYWIPFTKPMDLPEIFPNLRQIIMDLKCDTYITHDLSEIFIGSLDSVKIMRIKHSYPQNFKNYGIYRLLETHFPHVVELEMNNLDKFKYKDNILWTNTLKKLTLHSPRLENVNLRTLSHLKGLERLELISKGPIMSSTFEKDAKFDFKPLSKTSVKSLKIQNYQIDEKVVQEIRSRYTLDYIPPRLDFQ